MGVHRRDPALALLGKNIAQLRVAKGYTQEAFSHELGVSVRTVAAIEAGATTTSRLLVAIADKLGASVVLVAKKR